MTHKEDPEGAAMKHQAQEFKKRRALQRLANGDSRHEVAQSMGVSKKTVDRWAREGK